MEKGICLIERLYVPYGQTVRFETLRVDKLIVDGNLIVEGKISAVICRGKGSVQVGDMEVDKLRLSSVTCEGRLKAREVISRRVYAESVHISKRIWCLISLVAKYLVAPCVATPLLGCRKWGPSWSCVIRSLSGITRCAGFAGRSVGIVSCLTSAPEESVWKNRGIPRKRPSRRRMPGPLKNRQNRQTKCWIS